MSKDRFFKHHERWPDRETRELQTLAREAGWTAPWDHQELRKAATKKSVLARAKSAKIRLITILAAYSLLDQKHKDQPYSALSLGALKDRYDFVLGTGDRASSDAARANLNSETAYHVAAALVLLNRLSEAEQSVLQKISAETLKQGLRQLGVRGTRGQRLSR
jgi:hypothetical protein